MKNNQGFTLIELLVVIAIIGILAAIVLVNLTEVSGRADKAKAKTYAAEATTALLLYYDDQDAFPPIGGSPGRWQSDASNDLTDFNETVTYIAGYDGTEEISYLPDVNDFTLTVGDYFECTRGGCGEL